jgi:hypothetical protein
MAAAYYLMGVSVADRMLIGPDDDRYQAETGRPVIRRSTLFSALPLSSSRGARKRPASVLGTHTMAIIINMHDACSSKVRAGR